MMRYILLGLIIILTCGREEDKVLLAIRGNTYTVGDFQKTLPTNLSTRLELEVAWKRFLLKKLLANYGAEKGLDLLPPLVEEIPEVERSTIIKKYYQKMIVEKTPLTKADFKKASDEVSLRVHFSQINFEHKEAADFAYMMVQEGRPFDSIIPFFYNPRFYNGDMGYVPYHFLSDETRAMLRMMKIGEVSPPFQEGRHWKLVFLKDKKKGPLKRIPEIKQVLREGLKKRKERLYLKDMVNFLKVKYQLIYNDTLLPYLLKPGDSIPDPILSDWLVRMNDKELRFGPTHQKLYEVSKKRDLDPRDLLEYEIQNELLYREAIASGFDRKYEPEIRAARENVIADHLYKILVQDSINITRSEIDSLMQERGEKNRRRAEAILKRGKEWERVKFLIVKLEAVLKPSVDSTVLNRILELKEEK
ncbi:MAG TPA: hypothetical protein EYP24_01265 [bacterium (Candidatus Stahlbacteria)]|nr:hypothetical protein [Candidatus Stahlbacteria bacterium]